MPPPPPKKQKSVSSKDNEAHPDKDVAKTSAPAKQSAPTPNVLELLQRGPLAKPSSVPPTSSKEHVSNASVAPEAIFDCKSDIGFEYQI